MAVSLSTPARRKLPSGLREFLLPGLLLAIAATAVVAPQPFLGNASGHDYQFHVASWMEVAQQWHEHILYPRWAEGANWGFGEPRFVFYPPLSWILGAALGCLMPWRMVPGGFLWVALFLAGTTMWRLAREFLPSHHAIAAAILFAVNPYHLVVAYYRSDFAELLASALFPWMIWGAFRIFREGWRGVPSLALAFSGIWVSNAPAAVIATYSLPLLLVTGCVVNRNLRRLLPGGCAMAMGFGLAAFYILPAAWEQRWVEIRQVLTANLRPANNFLFTHRNVPEFVLFNFKVSGVALGIMLAVGFAAILCAWRKKGFPREWWTLIALAVAGAVLMLPPSNALWRTLPELGFVQFPWRWLIPLGCVFGLFVATAIAQMRRAWIGWLAAGAILLVSASVMIHDAWWEAEEIPRIAAGIRSGHGYDGMDEYQPLGCDSTELPELAPRVARLNSQTERAEPLTGARVHYQRWTAEEKDFSVEAKAPFTLALRLLDYPAWKVTVNGEEAQAEAKDVTDQMLLALPVGRSNVEVSFVRTWDRTAGDAISGLAAALLVGWSLLLRRRARSIGSSS